MKKILVIGSNSFSGSIFIDYSLSKNYEIIGVSRSDQINKIFLKYLKNKNFKKFKFYKCDLNKNLNLIIPTRSEIEKYEELAANIFHKFSNNKSEIDTLSKTRDTLLPKLMSGQVRVNNIKQTADA